MTVEERVAEVQSRPSLQALLTPDERAGRTEHTADLEAFQAQGLLTQNEVDRWQQLQVNWSDHGHRLYAPLLQFERRLVHAVRARQVAQQQPALLAARSQPELHPDDVRAITARLQQSRAQAEAAAAPAQRFGLPDLLPIDLGGVTFLDAPQRGGERQRWDLDAIKQANTCPDVLARYGIRVTGGKCRCPVHRGGSDQSMSVQRTYVNCMHPNCGFAGDVIWLTRALEGLSLEKGDTEAFNRACEVLGGQRTSTVGTYNARATAPQEPTVQQIDLRPLVNASAAALQAQRTEVARQAAAYLAGRGFDLEACARFSIGIVEGNMPYDMLPMTSKGKRHLGWRNRILIPDLGPDGEVLYLKARAFRDQELREVDRETGEIRERQKYLNPYGMHTRPFNMGQLPERGDVLMVEGEVDCLSVLVTGLTRSVIAVPGAGNLSAHQAAELAERGGKLYLLLDPDVDPLQSQIVARLVRAGCDVRLVPPLTGDRDDDLNALLVRWGPERLRQSLAAATRTTRRLTLS